MSDDVEPVVRPRLGDYGYDLDDPGYRQALNAWTLRWFTYKHLPADLQVVTVKFAVLARELCDLMPSMPDELNRALLRLLESKDHAVRAWVHCGPHITGATTQEEADR
jgi:hypothetical protein